MRAVIDDADGKRGEDIARLFAAELRSRHIAVCTAPSEGAPPPLGVVAVRTSSEAAFVEVDVRDDLTAKSLKREVALADVPSDVRALTVAVAADELLRASWAELALKNAFSPKQQEKVPAEVRDVVRDTMESPKHEQAPRIAFGAGAALDAFTAGSTLLGADVLLDVWIVPRLRVVGRFGLRSGLAASGKDGDVATSAIAFKLGAAVTVTPPQLRAGLDLALRAGVMRVAFVATPTRSDATARSLDDVAVLADAAVLGWLRLAPSLRALADAALSVPLRPVVATDAANVVTGVSGVGVSATLGLWGTF